MFIGSPYNLKNKVGNQQVMINDKPVTRYSFLRCLRIELDERMSWEKHIDSLCRKVASGIGIIKRLEPFVTHETLHSLYNSLVIPYFDCSPLWDNCGNMFVDKLQKLQNKATRVITRANYDVRSADQAMSWKNLKDRHKMNKSVLIFKLSNNHSAPNLKNKFITKENLNQNNYNLRETRALGTVGLC